MIFIVNFNKNLYISVGKVKKFVVFAFSCVQKICAVLWRFLHEFNSIDSDEEFKHFIASIFKKS